jgi:hypothetical protein
MSIPADIEVELQKFNQEATQILTSFAKKMDARLPPPIIYHYTNDLGLKGILESGKIWLTDIFSLNDPSELSHGYSHAVNILKSMVADGPPDGKAFCQALEAWITQAGVQEFAHFFVSSFSSNGDDLGQWRAYADNGRGYALGFDTRTLENVFTNERSASDGSNNTISVIYNDTQLAELQKQLIERMFHLIFLPHERNLASDVKDAYIKGLFVLFVLQALRAVLYFKHEAYSNEQEYRFLQIHRGGSYPAPIVKLRTRPYSLVRYREFDWRTIGAAALKSIVVGPAADKTTATQFAKDCLKAFHPSGAEISYSKIPYRLP